MRWALVLALVASCTKSDSVRCGDETCPAGSRCDNVHNVNGTACVSHDQATACNGKNSGDVCHADDIDVPGICDNGFCVPGCGDGVTQNLNAVGVAEECDDGNFQSHDGCSSACAAETPVWLQVPSVWQGRYGIAAAYMAPPFDKHVLAGGVDLLRGTVGDVWERDANLKWTLTQTASTKARTGAMMAYDSTHQKLVMFGGVSDTKQPLGDTWVYDGTTWTQITTSTAPSPRTGGGMVFDSARGKILLFGGLAAGGVVGDLWQFDVQTGVWSPVTTTGAIQPRSGLAMAYDAVRDRVVVFGGLVPNVTVFADTWDYNPATTTWTQNATTTHPSARFGASMTYQVAPRNKVVLFGGGVFASQAIMYNDQWDYDGATWTQFSGSRPPNRTAAALVPAANGALLLVGGASGNDLSPLGDAWLFTSAGVWADVSPEFPPPRESQLAYDTKHEQMITFAGDSGIRDNATWGFDSGKWLDLSTPLGAGATLPRPASPPWREFHSIAYDSKRDRVVIFGGNSIVSPNLDDTWEWNGETQTWSQYTGTSKPPARVDGGFVYDVKDGVCVLYGGHNLNDTWEFDGTTWTSRPSAGGPQARNTRPTMSYDPVNERVVLYDTIDGSTYTYTNHTWAQLPTVPTDDKLDLPPMLTVLERANLTFDPERHMMTLFFGSLPRIWELAGDHWQHVRVIGTAPDGRYNPGFEADLKTRRLLMFGGGAAGGVVGDTWLFGYRSETPDENCMDTIDNDSDQQIDAADPDCR